MLISKIVSGGQTGVDRGAIEAALECGFPYGGLIPKGRLAEDGVVPLKFDKMTVATRRDYLFRTEWNVTHSDATLIIAREAWPENVGNDCSTCSEELTGGTKRTADYCKKHGKPHLVIFRSSVSAVVEWLKSLGMADVVLNVAGPRESKAHGIQASTKAFVTRLIEAVRADS